MKPVVEEKLRELAKAARFALVGVSNTLIDFGVFTVLAQLLSVNVYLSQVLGYCAGTLNSYVLNRSWTFRSKGRFFSPALLYLLFDVAGLPKLGAKAGATAITMVVSFLVNRFWVFRE